MICFSSFFADVGVDRRGRGVVEQYRVKVFANRKNVGYDKEV